PSGRIVTELVAGGRPFPWATEPARTTTRAPPRRLGWNCIALRSHCATEGRAALTPREPAWGSAYAGGELLGARSSVAMVRCGARASGATRVARSATGCGSGERTDDASRSRQLETMKQWACGSVGSAWAGDS